MLLENPQALRDKLLRSLREDKIAWIWSDELPAGYKPNVDLVWIDRQACVQVDGKHPVILRGSKARVGRAIRPKWYAEDVVERWIRATKFTLLPPLTRDHGQFDRELKRLSAATSKLNKKYGTRLRDREGGVYYLEGERFFLDIHSNTEHLEKAIQIVDLANMMEKIEEPKP